MIFTIAFLNADQIETAVEASATAAFFLVVPPRLCEACHNDVNLHVNVKNRRSLATVQAAKHQD